MNQTELICDLCAIIERQNAILRAQALELAQWSAVAEADTGEEI